MKLRRYYSFLISCFSRDGLSDEDVDKLFESGCNDVLVLQRGGDVYLCFDRKAFCKYWAIKSALRDIKVANLDLKILKVIDDEYDPF